MRRLWRLWPQRIRRFGCARPPRPPASRAGGGRHRRLRWRAVPRPSRHGPCRREFQLEGSDRPTRRILGDRPCPLCDDRRGRAAQRAAAFRRFRVRRPRHLPQRQSHQFLSSPPPTGAPRSLFQSTSDTEVIVHLIATSLKHTVEERMVDALRQVEGAYSLVAITQDGVIGVRDPLGVRPLVLGRLGESWILASETCALDIIGAQFVRDIEPGEMVTLNALGVQSIKPFERAKKRFCVFEYIYFARPDSFVDGQSVYEARKRIGAELARESHVAADIVIPVPDSGVPAALGYAGECGLPFELGIIRNHYVGRTFIEPTDQIRHLGVKLKQDRKSVV